MTAIRKLKVLDGLHAGAELALIDGTYTIGSDFSCDLVLLDRDVAKQHLRLVVAGEHINAETLSVGVVELDGVKAAKNDMTLSGNINVKLGSVNLLICQPALATAELGTALTATTSVKTSEPMNVYDTETELGKRSLARNALILALVISLAATAAFFGLRKIADPKFYKTAARKIEKQSVELPNDTGDAFVERVREFLTDDSLDVRLDKKGRIVVSGTTNSALVRTELQRVQKEFSGAIEVKDKVAYVLDKTQGNIVPLPEDITEVSVGTPSWFRTADGTRNFVGSRLADGAEVVRISLNGVLFRRDGKLTVFQLDDKGIDHEATR